MTLPDAVSTVYCMPCLRWVLDVVAAPIAVPRIAFRARLEELLPDDMA
jgi:hypothetical protein